MKDPRRELSPRVASVHESSPAFEASMKGELIIPSTWGDLASRIVEEGLVEPDVETVCNYLQISREELTDPAFAISSNVDVANLRSRVEEDARKEFIDTEGEIANEFDAYIDERIAGWTVEDGDEQATKIQEQIDAEEGISDEIALLCLKRDALSDGVQVPLIDFVKAVFVDFHGQGLFTKDELADCIAAMVDEIVRNYVIDEPGKIKVEDITIGKDQIEEFMWTKRDLFRAKVDRHSSKRWEELKPFIYAPSPDEYPLIEHA